MPGLEVSPSRAGAPLYKQVELFLREQITSGALQSGDLLPSVKELCDRFGGINHLTVRQAIKNLAEENLVRSVQGRGSYVLYEPQRAKRVALLLPHLEDTLFVSIARGAQDFLETQGVHAIILDSRGSEGVEAGHISSLKNLPLDGALIFPIADSNIAEEIFRLKVEEYKFVLVDRYFEDINAPCVVVDNYQGGYLSGLHLAAQGRRRVAWLGELRSTAARQRLEGFRSALNDADIACPSSLIQTLTISSAAPVPYHDQAGVAVCEAVETLLRLHPSLDGLVCCDDACALVALKHLKKLKVRVPDQVAVIGFDDLPAAGQSSPTLTTIRQPMVEMGRAAAAMLLQRLQNPATPVGRKVLPVELIQRESA